MDNFRKPRTIAWGALGIFLAGTFNAWAGGWYATVVTVDPSETYQVMEGWEVTAGYNIWEQDKRRWALRYRDLILDHLVNELGINRIRIEIASSTENPVDYWTLSGQYKISDHHYEKINDNDNPNVANLAGFQFSDLDNQVESILLPLKQRIEDNGEKLFVNLCYVDFNDGPQGNVSFADSPAEYAELIAVTFSHLRDKYGFTPDALEIVLEPENTTHWGGRQIGEAIVATDSRLRAEGFSPRIIAPSTMQAEAAPRYIDEMMAVPGVAGRIHTFSYHAYDSPSDEVRAKILQRAKKYGVQTAMLEHLTGDAKELHPDLTEVNVSAWEQYAIASDDDSNIKSSNDDKSFYYFVDIKDPEQPTIRMGKRTPLLAQYFKFIRMGATRIGARSDNPGITKAVAFRNTNGTYVVVVRAQEAGLVSVQGLPPGAYGARFSDGDTFRDMAVTPSTDGRGLSAAIPAAGVITFHQTLPVKLNYRAPLNERR